MKALIKIQNRNWKCPPLGEYHKVHRRVIINIILITLFAVIVIMEVLK